MDKIIQSHFTYVLIMNNFLYAYGAYYAVMQVCLDRVLNCSTYHSDKQTKATVVEQSWCTTTCDASACKAANFKRKDINDR